MRKSIEAAIPAVLCFAVWFAFPTASLHAEGVVITEILTSNRSELADVDGDFTDWIELCNLGDTSCDLGGYFLTDSVDNLEKWEFPSVTIQPGEYLVVFASEKNRRNPNGELHTNFRLDKEGDLLILVAPDGQTPLSGFAPSYPPQVTDASYGISTDSSSRQLVDSDNACRAFIPTDNSLDLDWTERVFDDSAWQAGSQGVGYERSSGYEDLIGIDVEATMYNANASAYIRIPFNVDDPAAIDSLVLRVKYDDGFVAFINGTRVADANAPGVADLAWNSDSTSSHADSRAVNFEDFDVSGSRDALRAGNNVLAIQGINFSDSSSDFVIVSELVAISVGKIALDAFEFFDVPTPGAPNGPGFDEVSADVAFSHASGAYPSTLNLTLSLEGGGDIRYTTNGSNPTESSARYTGPISVTGATVVTARSFQPDKLPGRTLSESLIILNTNVRNFSSNLPILIVNTFSSGVGQNSFTGAFLEFIETDESGRAHMTDAPNFAGRGGVKVRGSSSTGFPKQQYAVEIWDEFNEDRDVPILGMAANSDWILYAPYSDKALMRNQLSYDWSNQINQWAVETRFCEVYFQTNSGRLSSAHYAGVYVFMEKIKRGEDRVDIAKIGRTDNSSPEIEGGYILKKDRLDPGDAGITTSRGHRLGLVEPKEDEISSQQRSYILGYLNQFEGALYGANFRNPTTGYRRYIDVPSFIDHHIMVEVTKNIDGYRLSTFMYKDRGGKLVLGPIWDYNLSLGNANYLNGWIPEGWYWEQLDDGAYPWFRRLFQDADFQQQYTDRWQELREEIFRTDKLLSQVDDIAALLEESATRNFNRWRILGSYVWPNWFIADSYEEEIDWMKGWISDRLDWYDSNYVAKPSFNQSGGAIDPPFDLTITTPIGTVHYTTNGEDPRLLGGGINPNAIEHGSSDSLELVSPDVTGEVRVLVPTSGNVDASWTEVGFNDASWRRSTNGIGVGYERSSGYENLIDLDLEDSMYDQRTSAYIRYRFELDDPSLYDFLVLNMKYDDGFMAYLNGNSVASSNAPASPAWNSAATGQHDDASAVTYVPFSLAGADEHLRAGTNVLAVHALNANTTSSDLLIVPRLVASSVEAGSAVTLDGPTQVRARARSGGRWSGLTEATFVSSSDLPLRVTEIMYHPANLPDGSPFDEEELEFLELQNIGDEPLDLTGVTFSAGIEFEFNRAVVQTIPAGEFVLLVRNLAAFDWFHNSAGLLIAGEFTGRLENAGEEIGILDGRGELVQTFTYDDLWQPATDGGGHSLHIIDSAGPKESWDQAPSWRASEEVDGSPGFADGSVVPSTGWQLPGDSNGDGLLDISDPVRILRRLFLGKPEAPCDGDSFETGGNRVVADVNGDDAVDVSDVLYLLSHLYEQGAAPVLGTSCVRVVDCSNVCQN